MTDPSTRIVLIRVYEFVSIDEEDKNIVIIKDILVKPTKGTYYS